MLLALPQTYMNRSGYAVRCLAERYELPPEAILVVYDEVALPLGRLRARGDGGAAGHRGMESVIENLRSDRVGRLRLGIQPGGEPVPGELAEFVLAPFEPTEEALVERLLPVAADALELFLAEGVEVVMNRFNGVDLRPTADLG